MENKSGFMKINDNNKLLWDKLLKHKGHDVEVAVYGNVEDPDDVCLECLDCNEVILDAELYTLAERDDMPPF